MSESNQSHWIPLSDLMTGLMMVFMVVAIIFMLRVQQVATDLRDVKSQINLALKQEFPQEQLDQWEAEIIPQTLTIRFKTQEGLFPVGGEEPTPKFKKILDDFIPRYLKIVSDEKFKSSIKEILIEGHTSPEFETLTDDDVKTKLNIDEMSKKHMNNMTTSVGRTWWTLGHIMEITDPEKSEIETARQYHDFVLKKVHLHEMASSDPVIVNGQPDDKQSRRVEIKIVTNSDERLEEIAVELSKK